MSVTIICDHAFGPHQQIVRNWLTALDRVVGDAAARAIMLNFNQSNGGYGEAYVSSIMRPDKRGEGLNPAKLGHVIETDAAFFLEQVYSTLHPETRKVKCGNDLTATEVKPGDFLWQRALPHGALFPCSFRYGTRCTLPDIRVGLGDGKEALFDITSRSQKGHVLTKGGGLVSSDGITAGAGSWVARPGVAFIAEIHYPKMDRRDPVLASLLHQLDPTANPHPSKIPPRA